MLDARLHYIKKEAELKKRMSEEQRLVKEFHKQFGLAISDEPYIPETNTVDLRLDLIREEFNELRAAMKDKDLVATADALGDLLYVVYGTAVSCGLDMRPIFKEIHRSNMSKIGGHKREDGKWIKPKDYSPPDLKPLIERRYIQW